MKTHGFFAMLSRMKYIARWGLMRNVRQENLSEHTLEVAYFAHALALLSGVDPARPVFCALYHDCAEILTGDLPTPVKYDSAAIRDSYKQVERAAAERLLAALPDTLAALFRAGRAGFAHCEGCRQAVGARQMHRGGAFREPRL